MVWYGVWLCRWVNRKDPNGKNIFTGGFLGLDNIGSPRSCVIYTCTTDNLVILSLSPSPSLHHTGIFDRSRPLPTGGVLEQADGTAWMAFYCVVMLDIALELSLHDPAFEDMASKFFEHFVMIVDAMNQLGEGQEGRGLWDDDDGFYYDHLR